MMNDIQRLNQLYSAERCTNCGGPFSKDGQISICATPDGTFCGDCMKIYDGGPYPICCDCKKEIMPGTGTKVPDWNEGGFAPIHKVCV